LSELVRGCILFSTVEQISLASGADPSGHNFVSCCNVVVGSFSRLSVASGG